jgi:hypothetical protein
VTKSKSKSKSKSKPKPKAQPRAATGRDRLLELVTAGAGIVRNDVNRSAFMMIVYASIAVFLRLPYGWFVGAALILFGATMHLVSSAPLRGKAFAELLVAVGTASESIVWLQFRPSRRGRVDVRILSDSKRSWLVRLPAAEAAELVRLWQDLVPSLYVGPHEAARHKQWVAEPSAPRSWNKSAA